ncbi:hypothetical protein Dimus_013880, partial [Dionaea muscipula]
TVGDFVGLHQRHYAGGEFSGWSPLAAIVPFENRGCPSLKGVVRGDMVGDVGHPMVGGHVDELGAIRDGGRLDGENGRSYASVVGTNR